MRCLTIARLLVGLALAAVGSTTQVLGGELLIRQHFAGLRAIGQRADLQSLQSVLALPASQRVVREVATKLAGALPGWLGSPVTGSTNGQRELAGVVQALMDAESHFEAEVGGTGSSVRWVMAARVGAAESATLARTLGRELAGALGTTAPNEAEGSWEIRDVDRLILKSVRCGEWWLFGSGGELMARWQTRCQAEAASATAVGGHVLQLEANLARLTALLGWEGVPPSPLSQWPEVDLVVEPSRGRLRTVAHFNSTEPLDLQLEPWNIPTHLVREPLTAFTAVQTPAPRLHRMPLFAGLGDAEWPHQWFFWSLAGEPWLEYAAAPAPRPTNWLSMLGARLPEGPLTNVWRGLPMALRVVQEPGKVELRGLPYFAPFVHAVGEGAEGFLLAGLFPHSRAAAPAPQGLISQVSGRTNLVLYDWETTGRRVVVTNATGQPGPRLLTNNIGRLIHLRDIDQFFRLLSRGTLTPGRSGSGGLAVPGSAWINAALPALGDTVTEVSVTGPAQLTLVRQSLVGLNSLELLFFFRWLDNPAFPGWKTAAPATGESPALPPAPQEGR